MSLTQITDYVTIGVLIIVAIATGVDTALSFYIKRAGELHKPVPQQLMTIDEIAKFVVSEAATLDVSGAEKKVKAVLSKAMSRAKEENQGAKDSVITDIAIRYANEEMPEFFYYYKGILGTRISQSVHPAGIVISPVTLADNYGVFKKDGEICLQIDMDEIHEVSLVKYDLLALRTVKIISETCKLIGCPYPKTHEINWDDEKVWDDMLRTNEGLFQMESAYAFSLLKELKPMSIFDMSLVCAALRPSGASYRDNLIKRIPNKNPSKMIDDLLSDNNGYLIYQEDVIKFLQEICGLSGSEADNIRRAIGRKDEERLNKALPQILEGYCSKSDKPREVAEEEAKTFIQILKDASSYMFG